MNHLSIAILFVTVSLGCGARTQPNGKNAQIPKSKARGESNVDVKAVVAKFPEMVLIKAGTFVMGSPISEPDRGTNEQQKTTTVENDFYLGKYEVTLEQFRGFCAKSGFQTEHEKDGYPINWRKAIEGLSLIHI